MSFIPVEQSTSSGSSLALPFLQKVAPLPILHFASDAEIFAEGDDANFVYRVKIGVVRTCKYSADGRRIVDAFYGRGQMFGLTLGSEHGLCAEAVTDCRLVPYRRHALEDVSGPTVYAEAMRELERARQHAHVLSGYSAVQKLASFLLELSAGGTGFVELPMTRQDIGDYLGLTIETVSRTLAQLEKDGIIDLPAVRRVSLLNYAALRKLCN